MMSSLLPPAVDRQLQSLERVDESDGDPTAALRDTVEAIWEIVERATSEPSVDSLHHGLRGTLSPARAGTARDVHAIGSDSSERRIRRVSAQMRAVGHRAPALRDRHRCVCALDVGSRNGAVTTSQCSDRDGARGPAPASPITVIPSLEYD